MGILDDTLANFRGSFNSAGRGTRAASGVSYFGGDFNPGLETVGSEAAPGAGVQQVPSESGSFSSRGPQEPGRDLTQDPLSAREVQMANFARNAVSALPGGSLVAGAMEYNMGRDAGGNMNPSNVNVTTPDTLAGRTGFWVGQGNDLSTAAQAALARSRLGQLGGMALPAGLRGAGLLTHFGTEYAGQGFKGVGTTGYDTEKKGFTPGQEEVKDSDIVENGPDDAGPTGTSSYRPRDEGGSGLTWSDSSGSVTTGMARGGLVGDKRKYRSKDDGGSGLTWSDKSGSVTTGNNDKQVYRPRDEGGSGLTWSDSSGSVQTGYADGGIVGLTGPRYADGGEVQPLLSMGFANGGGVGLGVQGTNQATPQMVDAQVNRMLNNPQFRQKIVAGAQQLMQSGQLTPQEVQVMGQIAEASMHSPALYPKLRAFVAQQGMSPLPPAYDPSVIVKILAVTRALSQAGAAQPVPGGPGQTPAGQVPPTDQAQMQNPAGMANGGFLQGPGNGRSDSIGTVNESTGQPVKVANGEYVIPEHVVRAKGRDFFDKMLRQYAQVPDRGEQA